MLVAMISSSSNLTFVLFLHIRNLNSFSDYWDDPFSHRWHFEVRFRFATICLGALFDLGVTTNNLTCLSWYPCNARIGDWLYIWFFSGNELQNVLSYIKWGNWLSVQVDATFTQRIFRMFRMFSIGNRQNISNILVQIPDLWLLKYLNPNFPRYTYRLV